MLKERADIKWMCHQLNGTNITSLIPTGHTEIAALQLSGKIFRYAVVAVISLRDNIPSVGFGNQRIGPKLNIIRFFYQRAGQRCYHHPTRGVRLRVGGVDPAQHVAGILQNGMLKAATGTQEWDAVFTRIAYRDQRPFQVAIRTAWNDPNGIITYQVLTAADIRCG